MISEPNESKVYVWIWLPEHTRPIIAGQLTRADGDLIFNYGASYLRRHEAIPIYKPELPLEAGALKLLEGLSMPSCIRDAAPDAWGRRVIINRKFGRKGDDIDVGQLDELTYLIESGSNRIGALDFQRSPTNYVPRQAHGASLEELLSAAEKVESGIPLTPELDEALFHGSSLGGARPKAMIEDANRQYVAKFSSRTDVFNVVKAEFVTMRLAAAIGLDVAPVRLTNAAGKDVLLVERFDRVPMNAGWARKAMVSALTLFGLDEMMARYASYETLAEIVRHRFANPTNTLRELFGRIVFNILCGNIDDHARNHAAFWDGRTLLLTPAYDICPQTRTGNEASQAMLIIGDDRRSSLVTCLRAASIFRHSEDAAAGLIERQITTIRDRWTEVCDEGRLSVVDRNVLWRRQFFNPSIFDGAPARFAALVG